MHENIQLTNFLEITGSPNKILAFWRVMIPLKSFLIFLVLYLYSNSFIFLYYT